MQIFVNCLGQTKCVEYTQGENVEQFCVRIQSEFELSETVACYNNSQKIEQLTADRKSVV